MPNIIDIVTVLVFGYATYALAKEEAPKKYYAFATAAAGLGVLAARIFGV